MSKISDAPLKKAPFRSYRFEIHSDIFLLIVYVYVYMYIMVSKYISLFLIPTFWQGELILPRKT